MCILQHVLQQHEIIQRTRSHFVSIKVFDKCLGNKHRSDMQWKHWVWSHPSAVVLLPSRSISWQQRPVYLQNQHRTESWANNLELQVCLGTEWRFPPAMASFSGVIHIRMNKKLPIAVLQSCCNSEISYSIWWKENLLHYSLRTVISFSESSVGYCQS